MIAAVLQGWASSSVLDAYEAERRPVADQISRLIMDVAEKVATQRREIPGEIESAGPIGDSVRATIGKEAYELDVQQQCCGGLNFGYFYGASPIIAYDEEQQPAYTMQDFTPSTVPGCRAPHLWLEGHRSLYDALGSGYALIRLAPHVRVSGLVAAAERRNLPLTVLDVNASDARSSYARDLVLVRPDQHVGWRGNQEPAAPLELIDLLRGAGGKNPAGRSTPRAAASQRHAT
jgi:hypothetical protein